MKYSALLISVILLCSACGGGGASASDPEPQVLETYSKNDPPNITDPGPLTILEGRTEIYNISALDPENLDVTQTIVGGADASKFSITESGQLSFNITPDYEQPADADANNVYELIVSASDGVLNSSLNLYVTVSDAVEGRIVDGPLKNGKVFIDLNGNSKLDFNEPLGFTDENGYFSIRYEASAKASAIANLFTARVIAIGGEDTFTDEELPNFAVISDLPTDPTQFVFVTPITTIVAAASTIEAKTQVLLSLNIDITVQSLLTTPIWKNAEEGDSGAKSIQRESLQVAVILQSEKEKDGLTASELVDEIATKMANEAIEEGALDLTKPNIICEVLDLDESLDEDDKNAVCEAVSEMNSILDSEDFDPVSETAKQVTKKAQSELQANIDALEEDDISKEDFQSQTDPSELLDDVIIPEDENSTDTDGDGVPDVLELDDDGDGLDDKDDGFPKASLAGRPDNDNDGRPDECDALCIESGMVSDSDDDNDGVSDEEDAYPLVSVADYLDADGDGIPDDCDATCEASTGMKADKDDDNDGFEEREPMQILTPVAGSDGNSVSIPFATANGQVSLRFITGASGWVHDVNEDNSVWVTNGLYLEEAIDEVLLLLTVNSTVTTPDQFIAFFATQTTLFVGGDRFPGSSTQTFDTDGDGIPNSQDDDLDGDGLPNVCDEDCLAAGGTEDLDDDNDGFSDSSENNQGTDPEYQREYPGSGGFISMGATFLAGHERNGIIKIPVRRFFSSKGAVEVTFKTVAGVTGKANEHYVPQTGIISWDDGDFSEKYIDIQLKDNGKPDKYTFSVELEASTRGALVGSWKTVIYVDGIASQFAGLSNFPGAISPVAWGNTFEESKQVNSVQIKRWAGSSGTLSVNYVIEGCDLVWDYTKPRTGSISWNSGEIGPKSIPIKIVPDSFASYKADTCSGKVRLSNLSNNQAYIDKDLIAVNNGIDFTYLNDDIASGGIIQSAQIDTAAEEEAGSIEVRFIRRGPAGGNLTIDARTEDGSRFRIPENSLDGAGVGIDYLSASISHSWQENDMQPISINIPLVDDLLSDKDHAFGIAFDWNTNFLCGTDAESGEAIRCDSAGSSRTGVFIYDYLDDNNDLQDLDGDRVLNYADRDVDGDGQYNWIDDDDDGDGVKDNLDSHPYSQYETVDTDLNGIGNNDDPDNDGDGILDPNDMYPLISLGSLLDSNLDGQPNNCDIFCLNGTMSADPDDDGDSVADVNDATPLLAGTPCTEYYKNNTRYFGVTDGTDCYYDLDFAEEGDPILVDLYFAALPSLGAHKFAGSLIMGKANKSDAELATDGVSAGGDGPTVTIEAGANLAFANSATSLIINRGSRIIAEGNQQFPITLTSYGDTAGTTTSEQAGQWGGLIINGFAVSNRCEYVGSRTFNDAGNRDSDTLNLNGECHLLSPIVSLSGTHKNYYGGDNATDNSGILSYLVVKHAGGVATNFPAGITLNGVGTRTVFNHVQVYSSYADGLALIGGTVDIKNFSSVYARDDSLVIDEGYAGFISYGLLVQSRFDGNHCVEVDGIGDYLNRSTATINDIVNRGINSRPILTNITCIFSPNGAADSSDPTNPAKQGSYGPGAGYLLREGSYPRIIDSLTIGSFGAAINTGNYGIRIDDIHTLPGLLDGFTQIKTNMFAVEFDDLDVDYQTGGVGDEDNPNPNGIGDNDGLKIVAIEGLGIKDWLSTNGGNIFAEVAEGGMDASTEGDAALTLLEGAPPLFSIDGAFSEPSITATSGAFAGGLNLGEFDWAADWNYGLYPNNRAKAAWFDIVGLDADPASDADTDGDGVTDLLDSFPSVVTETLDTDGDGTGNNADSDDDGDGINDANDAHKLVSLVGLADFDGDGSPNECAAACVLFGMNADTDDDGDGIADAIDPFPLFNATAITDTDSDGLPDNCDAQCIAAGVTADPDDDGDGIIDTNDPFPLINQPNLVDTDGDGLPNTCNTSCVGAGLTEDLDDDDDNVLDVNDTLSLISVSGYADLDQDGLPNSCNTNCLSTGLYADTDDDGDGVLDTADPFPLISVAGFPDEDNNGYPDVCNTTCLALGMTVEPGGPWSQIGNSIGGLSVSDNFGGSVAINGTGNIVAIGAHKKDLTPTIQDVGQVQVWIWTGTQWSVRGQYITGLTANENLGHSIALSSNGNRLVTSAPFYSSNKGVVEVWDWNNNSNAYQKIYTRIGSAGSQSGYAVAISADGNRLAIGEPFSANTKGTVIVLDLSNPSAVSQVGTAINGDVANGAQNGFAVAIKNNGDTLAIGDPKFDGANTPDNGHVRVYDLNTVGGTQNWILRGDDIEGSAAGDLSGSSLDLSDDGTILAIGSPDNDPPTNSGQIRVFQWTNNSWALRGSAIKGSGNAIGEKIGSERSLSLNSDGTILATGGRYFDSSRGRTSVYKYLGTVSGWQLRGSALISQNQGDQAGASVDLSDDGRSLILGAPFVDGTNGADSGRAKIYDW